MGWGARILRGMQSSLITHYSSFHFLFHSPYVAPNITPILCVLGLDSGFLGSASGLRGGKG